MFSMGSFAILPPHNMTLYNTISSPVLHYLEGFLGIDMEDLNSCPRRDKKDLKY